MRRALFTVRSLRGRRWPLHLPVYDTSSQSRALLYLMKQIIPGLWQFDEIGSNVHCYLWAWEQGYTLIDAGFPRDAKTILAALAAQRIPFHQVRRILVTHADLDHTGGVAAIKRATGARVVCHTVEKEYLEYPMRRQPAAWFMR